MNFPRVSFSAPFVFLLLIILPFFSASGIETINLGPLFYMEKDNATGEKRIDALGPFVSYKKEALETEYGLRPIFYNYRNDKKDRTAFDFLYPLSTYRTFEGDTKFQALVYIIYYKTDLRESGFRERELTIFPFIFARQAEDPDRSFFAVLPIFGNMKSKYGKDEINFFMFP